MVDDISSDGADKQSNEKKIEQNKVDANDTLNDAGVPAPVAPVVPQAPVMPPAPVAPIAPSAPQAPAPVQAPVQAPVPHAPAAGGSSTEYWDTMHSGAPDTFASGNPSISAPVTPVGGIPAPNHAAIPNETPMGMDSINVSPVEINSFGESADQYGGNTDDGEEFYEELSYEDNIAADFNLPPMVITTKIQAALFGFVFLFSLLVGAIMFGGSNECPKTSGLRGVVSNVEAEKAIKKGAQRCGRALRTSACVMFLQNPRNRELYAKEFYSLVSDLTGVPKFLIESENIDYGNTTIKPGYIGMYNIPAFHN